WSRPALSKGTLGTWWFHRQRGGRTQSRQSADACDGTRLWTNQRKMGRMCTRTSTTPPPREGPRKKGQGFKPDHGKSGCPGLEGGLGKRDAGGNVHPSRNRKGGNGNPPPYRRRVRALSQQQGVAV